MLGTTVRRKRMVVLLLAAAIAIGAAGCLPDTGPPPTDGYQRGLFDALNRDRANHGLPHLTFSPKLVTYAGPHSCEMAQRGVLFHSDLGGMLYGNPEFANFWTLGENVTVGPAGMSMDQLEAAWMASPNHRANILSPNYNIVGVAVCATGGRIWATQLFGAI